MLQTSRAHTGGVSCKGGSPRLSLKYFISSKEPAMTHQNDCSVIRDLVDLAMEHGPDAMVAAFTTLMNRDKQIEREQVLKAESRSETIVKATPTASSQRF
jgi:hypothetical protein